MSRPALPFADRIVAADALVEALVPLSLQHPLVLAIPRGALPMGARIAKRLGGELDVVLVRKLGAPGQPQCAIGAIDETGRRQLDPRLRGLFGDDWIEAESARQLAVLEARRERYRGPCPAIDPAGRDVVVVDDGMATGSTMAAAMALVRGRGVRRLVCAVPVASREALDLVRPLVDDLVCLFAPERFEAVGLWYRDFSQVEDEEALAVLGRARGDDAR